MSGDRSRSHARPVRVALVTCAALLLACALCACNDVATTAPLDRSVALDWQWTGQGSTAITAVRACSPEGPFLVGESNGMLNVTDSSGASTWKAADAGLTVTGVWADPSCEAVVEVLQVPAESQTATCSVVRAFDAHGRALWERRTSTPGIPMEARLSADGDRVLVFAPAGEGEPATLGVYDVRTGDALWSRQTPDAPFMMCDTTDDLSFVVAGYVVAPSDDATSTGLVEVYANGETTSVLPCSSATFPAIVGDERVVLADETGALHGHELRDGTLAEETWCVEADSPGIVQSEADVALVNTYRREQAGDVITEVTSVRVFAGDGSLRFRTELRGTAPYLPTLSRDGGVLALIPRDPKADERAVLVTLDGSGDTTTLPAGVTAIDFGAGAGRMFVGMADGTYGVADLPR